MTSASGRRQTASFWTQKSSPDRSYVAVLWSFRFGSVDGDTCKWGTCKWGHLYANLNPQCTVSVNGGTCKWGHLYANLIGLCTCAEHGPHKRGQRARGQGPSGSNELQVANRSPGACATYRLLQSTNHTHNKCARDEWPTVRRGCRYSGGSCD